MTKAIAKQDASKTPWTQEQLQLITNTVAKGATPDELKLFLYTASRTGLDPLTKQIHFVKRGAQMTVQTGIDGYRAIAERTKTLAGIEDAVYDSEDGPHPNKATVTVYRLIDGERVSYTASARWSEYVVQDGFMWRKMPYLMLAKCAEALALRKAFPNDLSGLYTNEEMQQADNTVSTEYTPPRAPETVTEPPKNDTTVEGEVVEQKAQPNGDPQKECPHCHNWHSGSYPTCLSCFRQGKRNPQPVKKVVNYSAEPFKS